VVVLAPGDVARLDEHGNYDIAINSSVHTGSETALLIRVRWDGRGTALRSPPKRLPNPLGNQLFHE
jgi:hypothetical protein